MAQTNLQVKMLKTWRFGPFFDVGMLTTCRALWREAHLQVKMLKTWRFGPFFDVGMLTNCRALWREANWGHFRGDRCQKTVR